MRGKTMIIIETCPECGHDLMNEMLYTYPPIRRKVCCKCSWSWEGEIEEIIRVPFCANTTDVVPKSYLDNTYDA